LTRNLIFRFLGARNFFEIVAYLQKEEGLHLKVRSV